MNMTPYRNMTRQISEFKLADVVMERLKSMNIEKLTTVQDDVIRSFTSDLIVKSPTGTGKTLAYLIPIANYCANFGTNKILALILVPTRELAYQVGSVLFNLGIKSTIIIGGTDDVTSFEAVLIATPGRFNKILLNSKCISVNGANSSLHKCLQNLEFLILDEADKLLSLGFRSQLFCIANQIKARRKALMSATIGKDTAILCKKFLRSPRLIENTEKIPLDLKYICTGPYDKLNILHYILKRNKKVICFFLTCNEVDYFHMLFIKLGFPKIIKIHGKMQQEDRSTVYKQFDSILFGTDLASRGIDFPDVDIVVHFDIPLDPDSFVHRSGRTGRNHKHGQAILFVTKNELKFVNYLRIKNIPIEEIKLKCGSTASDFTPEMMDANYHNTILLDKNKKLVNMTNHAKRDDDTLQIKTKNNMFICDNFEKYKVAISDDILSLSVKAFVAHISAYKQHALKYLLDFRELDFDSLAKLHFLTKIPRMKELSGIKFANYAKNNHVSKA